LPLCGQSIPISSESDSLETIQEYARNARAVFDSLSRFESIKGRYEIKIGLVATLERQRDNLAIRYADCRADNNELAAKYVRLDDKAVRFRRGRRRAVAVGVMGWGLLVADLLLRK
jgi:cell division FtsZ-interacting protein ZapD